MAKPIAHYGRWRIRWIDEAGQRKSAVFDSFKEATAALRQEQHRVDEVLSGKRRPTPPKKSFGDLCDYYLAHQTPQKRRPRDDQGIIRVHLRPAFGEVPLTALDFARVEAYKGTKRHLHRKTIHHHLTLLISMLRVAHDLGWITTLPKIKKPKIRLFETDYAYLRSTEEIRRFLVGAQAEGPFAYAVYSMAVYTGMRAGEIAGLKWSDIDFDRRLIAVQRSFHGLTKGGDVRYVPILDPLLPVLRGWRVSQASPLVFTNSAGKMLRDSDRIFQEILHRVLEQAGFQKTLRQGKTRPYIRFHDLRHTFASNWVMSGGSLFKLQRILGHKSIQMTQRYSHLSPDAFSEDHARLGSRLAAEPPVALSMNG